MVVKLNAWLLPYFRADPICFKSEPLTGLDPDLGLIVSRLWVGLGHQMAQWPHMYNAGKIFFTIVFYGKKEKQLTKPFTFWKWKLIPKPIVLFHIVAAFFGRNLPQHTYCAWGFQPSHFGSLCGRSNKCLHYYFIAHLGLLKILRKKRSPTSLWFWPYLCLFLLHKKLG